MNPLWALLFKDRIRTPFSVYKMSFAEVLVLCGLIFGIGYGITKGGTWIADTLSSKSPEVVAPE